MPPEPKNPMSGKGWVSERRRVRPSRADRFRNGSFTQARSALGSRETVEGCNPQLTLGTIGFGVKARSDGSRSQSKADRGKLEIWLCLGYPHDLKYLLRNQPVWGMMILTPSVRISANYCTA